MLQHRCGPVVSKNSLRREPLNCWEKNIPRERAYIDEGKKNV